MAAVPPRVDRVFARVFRALPAPVPLLAAGRSEGGGMRRLRPLAEGLGALIAYCLVALAYWPGFLRHWRDRIAPDLGDPLFNLYLLDWVERQIRLGLPDLYGANFFHPLDAPLLLSDHLLGLAVQGLAIEWLTGVDSIGAYNLLVFLAFPLSGLTAAAVGRAAGLSRLGAFVAGAVYAFAPYHWSQLSHLQVLTYQWVPPTLWLFDRLLAAPRARTAVAFLVCYLLLVTGGNYLAAMAHVPLAVLLLFRGFSSPGWRALLRPGNLAVLLPTGVAAAAATTVLFLPYAHAAAELGLVWSEENYRVFGATLVSFLTPSAFNLHFEVLAPVLRSSYRGSSFAWIAEKSLFLGLVPLALLMLGLRRTIARRGRWGREAAAFALVAVLLLLVADLFTLGRWPTGLPATASEPGSVYTALGSALLALVALWAWRGRGGPARPPLALAVGVRERGLLLAGAVSLLLCFPVFYEPLTHLLPGFGAMRVPTRFFPFALLAAALMAGRGADALAAAPRSPWTGRLAATAALALLLVELAPRAIPWHPVPRRDPPAVTGWLANADEVTAVLHLPLADDPVDEIPRLDLSTLHWRPLVNGYSGHFPAPWRRLRRICCWPMPDARVLAMLRDWEVSHLVIHPRWERRWQQREYRRWAAAAAAGELPGVERVWVDPASGDTVFRIDRGAPARGER